METTKQEKAVFNNETAFLGKDIEKKTLGELKCIITRDWKNVNFGAKPYLDTFNQIDETGHYGMDGWKEMVLYFLCNASSWKGETAKAVKKELNRRVKANKL